MSPPQQAALPRQEKLAAPAISRRSRWTLPIAAGAGFLAGLDTTAVNLALPDIQRTLAAGPGELPWVVNAFALLSAALLVTAGKLSDRFGRRRVFVVGLLAFAAASAACGLAPSALLLDLARAAQGAAAAAVTASGLAVLASSYPPPERGRALGVYSAIAALSFVVGPLVGGLLTDLSGWRAVFLANVPVAVLIAVAARVVLPELRDRAAGRRARVRLRGRRDVHARARRAAVRRARAATRSAGRTPGSWPPSRPGWRPRELRRRRAARRRRHRGPPPLPRPDVHRSGLHVRPGGAAYFGMLVYLSLFLQGTQHYDAIQAGLVYLPTILPFMIISPMAGRLVTRVPGALLPTVGLVLIACGMLLLAGVNEGAGLLGVSPGWPSPGSAPGSR